MTVKAYLDDGKQKVLSLVQTTAGFHISHHNFWLPREKDNNLTQNLALGTISPQC